MRRLTRWELHDKVKEIVGILEVGWSKVIGINLDSGEFSEADVRIHDLREIELKLIYDSYELRL